MALEVGSWRLVVGCVEQLVAALSYSTEAIARTAKDAIHMVHFLQKL